MKSFSKTLISALSLVALATVGCATSGPRKTADAPKRAFPATVDGLDLALAPGERVAVFTGYDNDSSHELSGDPVLRVWEVGASREVGVSDNHSDFGGTRAQHQGLVEVENTSREYATYEIYVHASGAGAAGTTSVLVETSSGAVKELARGFVFNAIPQDVPCRAGRGYDIWTVLQPLGAADTFLLGLASAACDLLQKDHDGGVDNGTVRVELVNVNDNPSLGEYTFVQLENQARGSLMGRVTGSDEATSGRATLQKRDRPSRKRRASVGSIVS